MNQLKKYLTNNKSYLKFSRIEKRCGISGEGTLNRFIQGKGGLSYEFLPKLIEVLAEIGGGRFCFGEYVFIPQGNDLFVVHVLGNNDEHGVFWDATDIFNYFSK